MSWLSKLVESADFITLIFLIALLHVVGTAMSAAHARAVRSGKRLAGATILLYSWNHLHAGNFADAEAVTRVIVRALLSAGIVWGTSLIILTPLSIVLTRLSTWWQSVRLRHRERQRLRQQTRLAEQQRQEAHRRQRAWDAQAPERERQRLLQESSRQAAEQRQRDDAARLAVVQQRREALRFNCQLLFERHAAQLREVLSEERFKSLIAQAIPESLPIDAIENRVAQLGQMIEELVANTGRGRQRFRDLFELTRSFEDRQRQIEQSTVDERTKAALRSMVGLQQEAALAEFLKS